MNVLFKPLVSQRQPQILLVMLVLLVFAPVMVQAEQSVMSDPETRLDLQTPVNSDADTEVTASGEENPAIKRLERFLDGLETFEAGFRQIVFDANQEVVERSSGYVMLQPPGRFRWEYLDPYPQLILSDGVELWMYDQDLEQVTVQPVDKKLASSPALVLTNRQDLEANYTLFDLGNRDGHYWVELQPKKDSEFERIWLAFTTDPLDASVLSGMELRDSFGQSTQLWFTGHRRNQGLKGTVFRFVVPEGVDVIRNTRDEEGGPVTQPKPNPAMPTLQMDL